jgi:hypothetical protein
MAGKKVDDNTSKDGVMIQRVISEVGCGSSYPANMKTNYTNWVLVMMNLDSFWGTVPPDLVPTFAKKETAKEA